MGVLKKGFEDAFFVIIVILTISIFILVLSKAWIEVKEPLADSINSQTYLNSSVNVTQNFNRVTDTVFLFGRLLPFILIGLFAFVFIGLSIYSNNTIMLFVGIIVLAVAVLLGMVYANIYQSISENTNFTDVVNHLTVTGLFMKYLPYIIVIIFIGSIITVILLKQNTGGNL